LPGEPTPSVIATAGRNVLATSPPEGGALDRKHFYGVDLLRGLCALGIVVYHYPHFAEQHPGYRLLEPVYLHGMLFVQCFWMISGFDGRLSVAERADERDRRGCGLLGADIVSGLGTRQPLLPVTVGLLHAGHGRRNLHRPERRPASTAGQAALGRRRYLFDLSLALPRA